MDEQRAWLRARRKRRLRILAVILCFCVLFTTYPDLLETFSVFAAAESEQSEVMYISDFKALPEEIRGQTVPVGTTLSELTLPDTLEAVAAGERPSGDEENGSEDDDGADDGEDKADDGNDTPGGITDTEDNGGTGETEEDMPSDAEDTEPEDAETGNGTETGEEAGEGDETGGRTEDNDADAGDRQPEEGADAGETGGEPVTDEEDMSDMESGEGESAPSTEREENESTQESESSGEQNASGTTQETHTVTMPEYYAENVISVQTLEHIPAEEQEGTEAEQEEEAVTIEGVAWQSEPEYDGNTEGTYLFQAVLPEGYVLAEGLSLPQITVTVESGTDTMIQALLDRIAALPDGEEYLAAEPDRDKSEKGYAAWEEKLYAYAEEALAIWEEYETLTEQQQARFSEEALGKLKVWVEIAKTAGESAQVMAALADSGTCGDGVYWNFDSATGVLTISGSGAMTDYTGATYSPFEDNSAITKIIIEDGVTSIGDTVFLGCDSLTKVEIPSSVKRIGEFAFQACDSLTEVEIPSSVKSIGMQAFFVCEKIQSIKIPFGVVSIEPSTFDGCRALQSVEIPSSVTSIRKWAFSDCRSLTEVEIPSSVTSIGEQAFIGCGSLTEVTIPDSVENIDSWAFGRCTGLTTVNFQRKEPPTAGEDIFDACSGLTNINIPSCQYIGGYKAIVGSAYQDKITASEHEGFTYTAAGPEVTQRCTCKVESATAELSIKEGADWDYTGSAITPVQVTYSDNWVEQDGNKPDESSIRYENNINPGEATAELTIGGATAQISFTIVWKDITAPDKPVLQKGVTLPADWTNTQDKIPLQLSDDVGVTKLLVSVDGVSPYTEVNGFPGGTGSVLYDYTSVLEGEHTYQFQAEDAEGNISAESDIFTIKRDQTKPVIGTLTYDNKAKDFLDWITGKKSMIIHVPVTDAGSGVEKISYTLTPRNADGSLDGSRAETKTIAVKDGKAQITFADDFRGTVTIGCSDRAGNAADSVTIGTAGSGGVIVEDRAPDITALADRNLSDTQQTETGGVAVSEGYYASAPALLVTVKDDTDNAVTTGLDSVSYQVGDSPEKPVTFDKSTLQKAAQAAFTIPAAEIPTGMTQIRVTASDNAGNEAEKTLTIKVKGPEKQPAAVMDYREEKLTGLVPGGEYLIGGTVCTADGEGKIPIKEGWFGSTISIVKKGSGSETTDSPAQSLPVPARPVKPTPAGVDVSTAGGTGKLTGLTPGAAYEISTDGGKTWESKTADGSGQITGLAPGAYVVRAEAGAGSFASENSSPVTIGAFQVKVTFMADGKKYQEISVDYGTALTDIPAVPPKKDAGDQTYTGEWCSDEQGTPAVFTNITADMTVYAVYTKAYTVTLQGGTGCSLSAEAGSESPVKEGGSFTFRFALSSGYQKTAGFAVKVNGVKVELTADGAYTISDIRENQTVTVEGVAKKPGKPSESGGDKEDGQNPGPEDPGTGSGGQNPDVPTPKPPVTPPGKPAPETAAPADERPEGRKPGTASAADKKPEGRPGARTDQKENGKPEGRPGTIPNQEEKGKSEEKSGTGGKDAGTPKTDSADAQAQTADGAGSGQTAGALPVQQEEVKIGKGTVLVTVACEEGKCTAAVADAGAVAEAVLTPGQQEIVNSGRTIEIRIDVTDISEKTPTQDKEVIESGIEAYREEAPGLVLGMYVDISLFVRTGEEGWNAVTETREPIEVVMGIPEKLQSDGRTFYIIRAHDGEYTFMNDLDGEPETITIRTDLFSSYAIAYVETDSADSGAKCSLCHICPAFYGVCCFIWLALILAVMGIVTLVVWRRRKAE